MESIAEYVKLFQQGDVTITARLSLLTETREQVLAARKKYDDALERLDYKISRYEDALKTGVLTGISKLLGIHADGSLYISGVV